jgi:hypothetical protein
VTCAGLPWRGAYSLCRIPYPHANDVFNEGAGANSKASIGVCPFASVLDPGRAYKTGGRNFQLTFFPRHGDLNTRPIKSNHETARYLGLSEAGVIHLSRLIFGIKRRKWPLELGCQLG